MPANNIRVVVTGIGAVCCFGAGVDRLWSGLTEKRTGQRPLSSFDASKLRSNFAAEVHWPDLAEYEDKDRSGDDATRLATIAAREAINDSGLAAGITDAGCILGSLCSSGRIFDRYMELFSALPNSAESDFPDNDFAMVAHQLHYITDKFCLNGPATLVSTACSSSTDAIGYAADFIRSGESEIMLAGGGDIITEFTQTGFCSVFSITRDVSRPFDKSRTGFFIGDGAGMLVLERLEHAQARGAKIYAEVLGYGLSNTAYHLTATSEDGYGEGLAVRRCLAEGGIVPDQLHYLNAHGTATNHNDLTEVTMMRSVFGEAAPKLAVSSIKANIGHCMGASGALEAIATIKCIEQSFIPPTLNSTGDIDEGLRIVVGDGLHLPIDYALSESFGFGGACSALLFGSPRQIAAGNAPQQTNN
jgi:3-oxoacyl-[acyl-carrier-protein] synthase II